MDSAPSPASSAAQTLRPAQVYAMAGICLLLGLAIGYLLLGSPQPGPAAITAGAQPGAASAAKVAPQPPPGHGMHPGHMPTLDDMKQMADKQAAPLLEKLKTDPNNASLLMQVGAIYHAAHQYEQAAGYYGKVVQLDPKNVPARTKLAASLYRGGNPDGAIDQLNQALGVEPNDANSLFNLGMIKFEGKQDNKGALAAWQKLLKTNPQLSPDRKAEVQKLMAHVQNGTGDAHVAQGAGKHEAH